MIYPDARDKHQKLESARIQSLPVELVAIGYIFQNPTKCKSISLDSATAIVFYRIPTLACSGRPGPGDIMILSKCGKTFETNCGLVGMITVKHLQCGTSEKLTIL
jgi:hypothetical protein